MKAKKQKNGIKVLLSLVIAITMIGIPASVFTATATTNDSGAEKVVATDVISYIPTEPNAGTDPYGTTELLNESFESGLGAWTVGANWSLNTTIYHTGGNSTIHNMTPQSTLCTQIDATGYTGVTLTYWTYSTDATADLNCTIDVNGVAVATCDIDGPTEGRSWIQKTVDLTAYANTIFTLCFNYSDPGTDAGWVLDDIVVIGDDHPTGIDIAVNDLVNLTCGERYNTAPRYIEAEVANYGLTDAYGVPFHFQIYQERPLELEQYKLWDMESCVLKTWEVHSYDSGAEWSTWTWTEKRANSPTHSWHTQPDSLATYEAYSNDSLILHDWFHVNTTVNGNTVSFAYLTFAYWCQGEFDGTNPIDYGTIYIVNSTGRYKVGGPYYDTSGEWKVLEGTDGIDISDWIGQDIKIEFNWIADATGNYEGWYIDDVNIDYSYKSLQPLIWSDYKYADLLAGEEKVIKSQLPWGTIEDGYNYYIQVYYANNISSYIEDYDLLNNEINCSIFFGDVCDAAVTNIVAPSDVELDHTVGYVEIPINITVYNNGTLAKDVPVEASAQHSIEEVVAYDDMESGDALWKEIYFAGGTYWEINNLDYKSPFNSWTSVNATSKTSPGNCQPAIVFQPVMDFTDNPADANFECDIHYDMPDGFGLIPGFATPTGAGGALQYRPWYLAGGITWDYTQAPFHGPSSRGWFHFDLNQWILDVDNYWENNTYWGGLGASEGVKDFFVNQLYRDDPARAGYLEPMIFWEFQNDAGTTGTMEGVWIDNVKITKYYAGETIWSDTKIVHLEPGESKVVNFTWNATEYCNYVISGKVNLECDMDPTNDEKSTTTRIHEWQYIDDYDKVEFDDNTCGFPDDWHIVEECSICPDDHFWWNGEDTVGTYNDSRNDVLQIDETFNFSGVTEAYLNFSTYYYMEEDADYGYLEVSNDSGITWFRIDSFNINSSAAWIDEVYHLVPTVTPLYSPYTDMTFDMPTTFFTENMHFRFRFVSDVGTVMKGWYLDDVNLTVYNGTWNTVFFDDMENGDAKWTHGYICYGNHWHAEDNFGTPYPGTDATAWWNGENRSWIATALTLINATYDWTTLPAWWSIDNNSGPSTEVYHGTGYIDIYHWGPGAADVYMNQTGIVLPASPLIYLDSMAWRADTRGYFYIEVTDGVTTTLHNISIPDVTDTPFTVDLTAYAGSTVNISFHYNGSYDVTNDYWGVGLSIMELWDHWEIWAALPGPTINSDSYYNNVDEKIIFTYDLTHAFEAILYADMNYSFAEDDTGYVDISTDGGATWKTLGLYTGSSGGWITETYDISIYAGGDIPIKIRFRFVSNETGVDYGWLVDNVSIDGKVDYKAPTISASLSPVTPDGNNDWYKSDVTITLTAEDNVKVGAIYYRIDGGTWLLYTGPITISVEGSHTVDYYAVDSVGNEGAHGSVSFKIDKTAPTASISTPQAGYIYFFGRELMPRILVKDKALIIGGLTAEATASDAMSGVYVVKFNEDGTTFAEDTSSPYSAPLPFALFKAHTLTATAEDFAGNTYTSPGVDYFKIF